MEVDFAVLQLQAKYDKDYQQPPERSVKEILPQSLKKTNNLANTLILDFQSHLVCGILLQKPQQTST